MNNPYYPVVNQIIYPTAPLVTNPATTPRPVVVQPPVVVDNPIPVIYVD
jgi:hypothetical protein